jgi:hypothetical protein
MGWWNQGKNREGATGVLSNFTFFKRFFVLKPQTGNPIRYDIFVEIGMGIPCLMRAAIFKWV